MQKLANFFYQRSTLIVALVLTAATFSYLFLVMMEQAKCFGVADSSVQSLGTSFGFNYEMVEQFLSLRSDSMLACFQDFNQIWDNLFAILYGLMYVVWLSLLFKPYQLVVKVLNLLPLVQVLFDFLENFNLASISSTYLLEERIAPFAVQLASFASMVKWVASGLVFLAIGVGIVIRIKSALSAKK